MWLRTPCQDDQQYALYLKSQSIGEHICWLSTSKILSHVGYWTAKDKMTDNKVVDDIIYYKGRIYLVPKSKLKAKILEETNDSPLGKHQGYLKTYRKIRERFSWKGLKNDVLRYV